MPVLQPQHLGQQIVAAMTPVFTEAANEWRHNSTTSPIPGVKRYALGWLMAWEHTRSRLNNAPTFALVGVAFNELQMNAPVWTSNARTRLGYIEGLAMFANFVNATFEAQPPMPLVPEVPEQVLDATPPPAQTIATMLLEPGLANLAVTEVNEQDFLALGNNALQVLARVWPMLPSSQKKELMKWVASWVRSLGVPEAADALETMGY